jgi:hypothetical protein
MLYLSANSYDTVSNRIRRCYLWLPGSHPLSTSHQSHPHQSYLSIFFTSHLLTRPRIRNFWLLYHYKLIHVASFRYLRHCSRLLYDKSRDVHARRVGVAFKNHGTGHGSTVFRVFIRYAAMRFCPHGSGSWLTRLWLRVATTGMMDNVLTGCSPLDMDPYIMSLSSDATSIDICLCCTSARIQLERLQVLRALTKWCGHGDRLFNSKRIGGQSWQRFVQLQCCIGGRRNENPNVLPALLLCRCVSLASCSSMSSA